MVLYDNDESSCMVFIDRQPKSNEGIDTFKNIPLLPVSVQCKDGRP